MTEYDLWKIFPRMPKKVMIGDITIRDGFQHEEKFISTAAKIFYGQESILAGCKELEVTNLGSPEGIPQFKDAEQVMTAMRSDEFKKRCERAKIKYDELILTTVTIREPAVDRAIEMKKKGIGPDRILMMVSTDPEHHFANSGTTLSQYWREAERCIKKATDAGIKMCGTVSTIWGSPISGATKLEDAVEFTKRWFSIGAYRHRARRPRRLGQRRRRVPVLLDDPRCHAQPRSSPVPPARDQAHRLAVGPGGPAGGHLPLRGNAGRPGRPAGQLPR